MEGKNQQQGCKLFYEKYYRNYRKTTVKYRRKIGILGSNYRNILGKIYVIVSLI